jgi:hypothetical protein
VLRDALTQADAVIAKPFAIDTLLTEVNRSRWRAVKRCCKLRLTSHPEKVIGQ